MKEPSLPRIVVGVGASAGGLEAFKRFMAVLPDDTGMAFLLVQHLDPTHRSLLVELLAPCTKMAVRDADQGIVLEANTVYVIRPDTALAVRDGKIELSEPLLHRGVRLPVDHLFRSLAREYGPRSVGIVLSGAGSDGSCGARDIRAAGGLTIAQEPGSGSQSGMPQSAIDAGVADLVLEIPDIPAALARFESLPPQSSTEQNPNDAAGAGAQPPKPSSLSERDLGRLASLLQARADFDIRVYKPATISRRVARRMTLSGIEGIESYFERLLAEPSEQQTLLRDLLISVTDFFRDPEAFRALQEMVVERAVAQASPGDTLRAWVPGCATGEEAYSIAMEFLDAISAANKRVGLQIFATDMDQDALALARTGIYPPSIADHVSESRLRRYFEPLDGRGYQVRTALRDTVSFAVHDLTKDPPFSRMHLVSCRNVLIYLTSEAQKHVLKVLHFALEAGGHLFLSTSESTGPQRELFSTISKTQRIYRKVGPSGPISVGRSRNRANDASRKDSPKRTQEPPRRELASGDIARRVALEAFAPPHLMVSDDGSVLFAHGDIEPYVRMPRGDNPRFELTSVLRPEIATRVRGALYKCRKEGRTVTAVSNFDGSGKRIQIEARPASVLGDGTVILAFAPFVEEGAESGILASQVPMGSSEHDAIVDQLDKELQATREDLRNTVEELETSNEELRTSNEESMSMNEELQSANEELEATTEELRSLNEELTTVNAQLREKVELLEQAHDDLNNFFASTKIATIFLDDRQCIKRFTPAARELLGIAQSDIGRSVEDIARELLQNDLGEEARAVLEHLNTRLDEIHTGDGKWIAREVLPYRTEGRRIEGVVVTFADITELKTATETIELRERQQRVVARLGLHALRSSQLDEFMEEVVREVQKTLGTDCCKILELQPGETKLLLRAGVGWNTGLVGSAFVGTGPDSQAGYTLQTSEPIIVDDLRTEKRFSGPALLTEHQIVSGLSCSISDGERPYGVLGAHTRSQRTFSSEDANFLQAVASVVASSIGRHQTRTRLALELGAAQILAETTDIEGALAAILNGMMRELSGSVGEIWWAENGLPMSCRLLDVADESERSQVAKVFGQPNMDRNVGLIGRVYSKGTALLASDHGNPCLFTEREGARALGLISGVALPVYVQNEVVGVISVYSRKRLFADRYFLHSLDLVGRAIGDFVIRAEFEQKAHRLAAITLSSHDSILSYRLDGTVTEWLPGAERLFGYSAKEMVGSSIERIVPEDRREELWSQNERIVEDQVLPPLETVRSCKDGSLVAVSVRSSPVRDTAGNIVGISSADRDISQQKETENKLIEADHQKDEFLAMLGHELRNPLAAIRSASELLKLTGGDDPRLVRTQAILDRQSAHMAKLLDGLLDVSRIIRGKIQLEPRVVDLGAVCLDVAAEVTERPDVVGLDVRTDVPAAPLWVKADPVRLAQIVDNLMSNAVKYTSTGGRITLSLTQEDGSAVLKVRDTGLGIEPDLLPYVFEVFRQSEQNLDRSHGGLGLGLALVKSLVEMQGGAVEARSEGKDRGAEFIVRMRLTDRPPSERASERPGAAPMNVLLVEDNEDAAELLRQVLKLSGHQVTVANRAQEGIDLARQGDFDVILCDIGLPDGMSGFDVAKTLRKTSGVRDTPMVALTGYGRPEDKKRCEEAGFDVHLTKPVDGPTLARLLQDVRSGDLTEKRSRDRTP